jgi:hypothetical protein
MEHERHRRFVLARVDHDRREQELALGRAHILVAQEPHALPNLGRVAANIVAPPIAARKVVPFSDSGHDAVVLLGDGTVMEEQIVPHRRSEVLAVKR